MEFGYAPVVLSAVAEAEEASFLQQRAELVEPRSSGLFVVSGLRNREERVKVGQIIGLGMVRSAPAMTGAAPTRAHSSFQRFVSSKRARWSSAAVNARSSRVGRPSSEATPDVA